MKIKMPAVCSKSGLMLSMLLYFASVLLMLPSLIQSTYIRVVWVNLLELTAVYGMIILIVYLCTKRLSNVLITVSACSLAVGNLAQPLMQYACHMDEKAASLSDQLLKIAIWHLLLLVIGWGLIWLADYLIREHPVFEASAAALVILAFGAYILLKTGKDNNTSAAEGGFQPAIIAAFLIAYLVAAALGRQKKANRITHIVSAGLLLILLMGKHEFGIPILVSAACLLYYLLCYPTPKLSDLVPLAALLCLFLIGIFIRKPDLLTDTVKKLIERPELSVQISNAQHSLRAAGWFGRFIYTTKVSESSSDLSFAASIHFWGYAWLILAALPFLLGGLLLLLEESEPHGFRLPVILRGICFFILFLFLYWNCAFSIHFLLPTIGVQAPFCGISRSFAVLSGLLLSAVTICDENWIRNILKKE